MEFYRSPIEHDPEYVRLLGLISARWTMTEEAVCHVLGAILKNGDLARRLYLSQGGFRQRIELVKAAVEEGPSEVFVSYAKDALALCYDLFKTRNKLMHSAYHVVVKAPDQDEYSLPALPNPPEGGPRVLWIGQGHPNTPARINKGVFKTHLEKLDVAIATLVDVIYEIEDDFPKLREAQPAPPPRKKPSTPRRPQGRTKPKRPQKPSQA